MGKGFKVGDNVMIIGNSCCHYYDLHSRHTIKYTDNQGRFWFTTQSGYPKGCFVRIPDITKINKQLSKNVKIL